MRTHQQTTAPKTAIGYVRVSTQEQATDGVSLDAQRDRLRTYCKLNGIKLIDIKADEGYSGSNLDRPGLQAALQMIRRGRVNTLIVAKLDRLSRSLRDVCTIVEELFSEERNHLLSLCGMVNTHSAAGRMVLMNLANYCQYEREMISERTRDALQHMKRQGIRLGPAHYGYELGQQLDEQGRRVLVPVEREQAVITQIVALRDQGLSFRDVARRLNEDQIPARRGGAWRINGVRNALLHSGKHTVRPCKPHGPRIPLRYDRETATERATELRAQGLSYHAIGVQLRKERLIPLRGGIWHPAQVSQLLQAAVTSDRDATLRRAAELRAQGIQLREIGVRLATEGFRPPAGGLWHPSQVHALLAQSASEQPTE
jgi:site-specific DNA recombinase